MTEILYTSLPEKITPISSDDEIIILDSSNGNIVSRIKGELLRGPQGEVGPPGPSGNGSGDMLISIYDTDGDGKVDIAKEAETAKSVDWGNIQKIPEEFENLKQIINEKPHCNFNTTTTGGINGKARIIQGDRPEGSVVIQLGGSTSRFCLIDNKWSHEIFSIESNGVMAINGNNITSEWTSWIPVISGGANIRFDYAKYKIIGKTAFVAIKGQIINTGSTSEAIGISVPFNWAMSYIPLNGFVVSPGANPKTEAKGDAETDGNMIRFKKGYSTAWLTWNNVTNNDWVVCNASFEIL